MPMDAHRWQQRISADITKQVTIFQSEPRLNPNVSKCNQHGLYQACKFLP